jgi:TetR/AcrR family transcriptional regulator, tetracycline repressor protein
LPGAHKPPSRETAKLDRTTIVEAAFAVLSEKGLDGLSLRVLATHLGVQAPALYWHVRNKAELIGMMAATFGEVAARAEPRENTWAARLIAYGHALRQAMLLHRDAARLCAIARPIEPPEENANRVAAPLIAAGLDQKRALSYQASVIAYTLGWVVYEQSQPMHEHLAQMLDLAESFASGLRAMVRGFVAEVAETNTKHRSQQRRRPQAKRTRD